MLRSGFSYKPAYHPVSNYLADFLTLGAANSEECDHNLQVLLDTCNLLGIPLATEKIEGPATQIVFLGILLDSNSMTMRLPEEKIKHL